MEYFETRAGLHLLLEPDQEKMIKMVEVRNISVHNRCRVNRRFIKRTGTDVALEGSVYRLAAVNVEELAIFLARVVMRIDLDAAGKFKLTTAAFSAAPTL